MFSRPSATPTLDFNPSTFDDGRKFRSSLSAAVCTDGGKTLFVVVDETVDAVPSIEQLFREDGDVFGRHQSRPLDEFFELPDSKVRKGRVREVDIEGLDVADSYLWLVGSHSGNRKEPKVEDSAAEGLERLATIERGKNRILLGCVPIVSGDKGSVLAKVSGTRHASLLGDDLFDVLGKDEHLGPFLRTFRHGKKKVTLPGKDNGFDIEGLAVEASGVSSPRIFLGLRGPVLRGWALVLELHPTPAGSSQLALAPFPGGGTLYRKHALDLAGLGVRDLCIDGRDLLILAGPTMHLDGPLFVYRWKAGLDASLTGDTLTWRSSGQLDRILSLRTVEGHDHAEGLTLVPEGSSKTKLLVVYDNPEDARLAGEHGVTADLFVVD